VHVLAYKAGTGRVMKSDGIGTLKTAVQDQPAPFTRHIANTGQQYGKLVADHQNPKP